MFYWADREISVAQGGTNSNLKDSIIDTNRTNETQALNLSFMLKCGSNSTVTGTTVLELL